MPYSAIAAAAVAAHFAFLGYLIGGGFLAWRWPVTVWVHAFIVGWTAIILTGVVECPLTTVERWARDRAGMSPLPRAGFIDHHVAGVLYPRGWGAVAEIVVIAAILASWIGLRRRHSRTPSRSHGH
ncbi:MULTISPECIES: DUF2784 domain-containing protein [unclassified Mycobacterium]|uniref:DUF2784 domain-containing protein n=1 Tax=unclassified Mycobacterium TaxID=2642494 RepID=UPI00048CD2E3|nr:MULTISPECIES: DUF2784 domain-containing protein [unclassified Mycobacterium]SEB26093.1 Protein of Unknown function [Mycobacterium sp. 283mftsu]